MGARVVILAGSAEEAESAKRVLERESFDVGAVVVGAGEEAAPTPPDAEHGAEAHRVERLATLGTLAAGTAHEVNNLLTHLLATLYDVTRTLTWLRSTAGADLEAPVARVCRGADDAVEACYQLRALARGITQYGQPATHNLSDVSVASVLDEAVQLVIPQLKRRAHLERHFAHGLPRIRANPAKLCQVFVNLLLNAAHAIDDGGSPREHTIGLSAALDGQRVRVDVRDSGRGIDPQHAPRVFEPFFTTRTGEDGTGLGLSVSRQIAHDHGGEIQFSTEVGAGTTFSVWLPAADPARD